MDPVQNHAIGKGEMTHRGRILRPVRVRQNMGGNYRGCEGTDRVRMHDIRVFCQNCLGASQAFRTLEFSSLRRPMRRIHPIVDEVHLEEPPVSGGPSNDTTDNRQRQARILV